MPSDRVVKLAAPSFDSVEIAAAIEVLASGQVTSGPKVREFEEAFAAKYGFKYAVAVNSGSSANLLALSALIEVGALQGAKQEFPPERIIVPAVTWPTSVWPIIQLGMKPLIVDIDPRTWCLDTRCAGQAGVDRLVVGALPVHVYGSVCDLSWAPRGLSVPFILIEDCCEALGSRVGASEYVGHRGVCATFSFYFSHQMTTMEGGAVGTNDEALYEALLLQRAHGWARDLGPDRMLAKHREAGADKRLDPAFTFYTTGYNFRMTELQATMGLVQLRRVDVFDAIRQRCRKRYVEVLRELDPWLSWQETAPGTDPAWFGFGLMVRHSASFTRDQLVAHLRANGVETRPIIAGNIARQPAVKKLIASGAVEVAGTLACADEILERAFSVGCHQGVSHEDVDYVAAVIARFIKDHG